MLLSSKPGELPEGAGVERLLCAPAAVYASSLHTKQPPQLLAEAEFVQHGAIALDIGTAEVSKQSASLAYELQQSAL